MVSPKKPVSVILGASKGLGLELVKQMQARGDKTIEIASSFKTREYLDRSTVACDLRKTEDVLALAEVIRSFPAISEFYWVAGRMERGNFADIADDDSLQVTDINFRGAIPIVQAAWQKLLQSQGPRKFVVVASSAGTKPKAGEALYVATKHAQVGFARSLGLENPDQNLSVCLFLPGGMRTGMWNRFDVPELESFSDPASVAARILQETNQATDRYVEIEIPRGLK